MFSYKVICIVLETKCGMRSINNTLYSCKINFSSMVTEGFFMIFKQRSANTAAISFEVYQ